MQIENDIKDLSWCLWTCWTSNWGFCKPLGKSSTYPLITHGYLGNCPGHVPFLGYRHRDPVLQAICSEEHLNLFSQALYLSIIVLLCLSGAKRRDSENGMILTGDSYEFMNWIIPRSILSSIIQLWLVYVDPIVQLLGCQKLAWLNPLPSNPIKGIWNNQNPLK